MHTKYVTKSYSLKELIDAPPGLSSPPWFERPGASLFIAPNKMFTPYSDLFFRELLLCKTSGDKFLGVELKKSPAVCVANGKKRGDLKELFSEARDLFDNYAGLGFVWLGTGQNINILKDLRDTLVKSMAGLLVINDLATIFPELDAGLPDVFPFLRSIDALGKEFNCHICIPYFLKTDSREDYLSGPDGVASLPGLDFIFSSNVITDDNPDFWPSFGLEIYSPPGLDSYVSVGVNLNAGIISTI